MSERRSRYISAYWSPTAPCSRGRDVVGSPRNCASVSNTTRGRLPSWTAVNLSHVTGALSTQSPLSGGGGTAQPARQASATSAHRAHSHLCSAHHELECTSSAWFSMFLACEGVMGPGVHQAAVTDVSKGSTTA